MEKRPERARREVRDFGRHVVQESSGCLLSSGWRVARCGVCVWGGMSLGPRCVLKVEPIGLVEELGCGY